MNKCLQVLFEKFSRTVQTDIIGLSRLAQLRVKTKWGIQIVQLEVLSDLDRQIIYSDVWGGYDYFLRIEVNIMTMKFKCCSCQIDLQNSPTII